MRGSGDGRAAGAPQRDPRQRRRVRGGGRADASSRLVYAAAPATLRRVSAPTESSSRDRTPARGTIRAQRAARRPTRTSGRPALLWGGLLLGAAAVAIGLKVAVGAMTRVDTVVAVLDSGGKPFAGCDLDLFAYDDSNAAP